MIKKKVWFKEFRKILQDEGVPAFYRKLSEVSAKLDEHQKVLTPGESADAHLIDIYF